MQQLTNASGLNLIQQFGRSLFAISLCAFGVLHFVYGDFVTRIVTHWPESFPARSIWVYLTGTILVATGSAVISGTKPRIMLTVLAALLALSFLLLHLPTIFNGVLFDGEWTNAGKALVLFGGCIASFAMIKEKSPSGLPDFPLLEGTFPLNIGRSCLAAFMILSGIQHFRWFEFVVTLVPGWVPGGGAFWTYATAILLLAGGIGLLIPKTKRLSALLSGAMIFLWAFMLHLPRVVNAVGSRSNEITATFEALAFSGLAFLYAANAEKMRDE